MAGDAANNLSILQPGLSQALWCGGTQWQFMDDTGRTSVLHCFAHCLCRAENWQNKNQWPTAWCTVDVFSFGTGLLSAAGPVLREVVVQDD